jgi:hypothetical protein
VLVAGNPQPTDSPVVLTLEPKRPSDDIRNHRSGSVAVVVPAGPQEAPMPAAPLVAKSTDKELTLREHARAAARPGHHRRGPGLGHLRGRGRAPIGQPTGTPLPPEPVGGGRRPDPADRGPPISGTSVLRVQVQESTPGLVDAVAMVRRG